MRENLVLNQPESFLSLRDLACVRDERALFAHLSADFYAGQLVQILGPNGSGKTTLLRTLAGLASDFHGEILWKNQKLSSQAWAFREQLLYLGHAPAIKKNLTPFENLAWYAASANFQLSAEAAAMALAQVNLESVTHRLCYQLSAGQQRRVALARLVLQPRQLWILDEPFTALDKDGVKILEQLIAQQLAQNGLVILTSHQDLQSLSAETVDLSRFPAPADFIGASHFDFVRAGGSGG